jgi:glycosyltransferase involved in cell wall biosynthesis
MRILKAHNYYIQSGGEDTVFHAETALLRLHGHEVIEYLEHNEKIESMNQVSVALQTIWSYSSYQKLKLFLREIKPDVVHFHNTFPLISPSAYYACQALKIPVVQTLDNQRLMCPAASFYRDGNLCLDCLGKTPPWPGVLHACYHHSHLHTAVVASMLTLHHWLGTWQTKIDLFLCSTSFYRDLFVQVGFPANKIVVMPHFIDEKFELNFSKQNGVGEYGLFLGRLDPEKGVNTLLEAWRHLQIPLRIRGNGRLDEAARKFVGQQSLGNVEFVGRLDDQELSDLIGNARFLIMPSEGYYETFGMVIIEAYARGVPVLASNIGVVPELVSDRQTGLLFEAGHPLDLAEKATWMWDHPEECLRMGHNARKEYEEKYTSAQSYEMLIDIYSRVIEGSKKQ